MSWAKRRQGMFVGGFLLFLVVVIGIPTGIWLYSPATCTDGVQNQGETSPDHGGPCPLLDESTLSPHAVMFARAFPVRAGLYSAVAYIDNPNKDAGVIAAPYRFKLYDSNNILIADGEGATYVMPGSVTPVFSGLIETGNRVVSRTFFEFAGPLTWERLKDTATVISVSDKQTLDFETKPRLTASAKNSAVSDAEDVVFIAVLFDPAGNAFATSQTIVPLIPAGESVDLVFTWPDPFTQQVGRVDVTPIRMPARAR